MKNEIQNVIWRKEQESEGKRIQLYQKRDFGKRADWKREKNVLQFFH